MGCNTSTEKPPKTYQINGIQTKNDSSASSSSLKNNTNNSNSTNAKQSITSSIQTTNINTTINTTNTNNNNNITTINNHNNNQSSEIIVQSPRVIDVKSCKQNKLFFDGIFLDMGIFCLDVFDSKYTGEKMGRWRAACIKGYNPDTLKVHIHFEGWKDKHDLILSLPDDLGRLAPSEILTDQQKLDGDLLTESQYEATQIYLQTGHLQIDDTILKNGDVFHLEEEVPKYQIDQLVCKS